jgi:hypothetical protein
VANGHVVEVEDRGLGMEEVTLSEFNERLAKPPEFDLADSDQLGLFVVSRLAARHQIKVLLRGSPYGGTTAIVLMPHRLVMAAEGAAGPVGRDAAPAAVAGPDRTSGTRPGGRGSQLELSAVATFPDTGRAQDPGLPRRLRQASLAPELRDPSPAASSGGRHATRSPDQVRSLISSIQQGWRNGRAGADRLDGSPDADPGSRAASDEAGR